MYIRIRNSGEIAPEALTLLGASTKREDDDKIGFFGSGIKYTVAYLLRENLFFKVYSGRNEIKFEIKEVTLGDHTFDQVIINGQETSITTAWGENWKRWQIFREIVANAVDEVNFDIDLVDEINPIDALTTFYLKYEDFCKYYDDFDSYFRPELINNKNSEILMKEEASEMAVFKKGVRILEEDSKFESLFDYHIYNADLNEERIASTFELRWHISALLTRCTDREVIEKLYQAVQDQRDDLFEINEVIPNLPDHLRMSKTWLEVLNDSDFKVVSKGSEEFFKEEKGEHFLERNNIKAVPATLIDRAKDSFGEEFKAGFSAKDEIQEDYIVLSMDGNVPANNLEFLIKKLNDFGIHFNAEVKLARFKKEGVISKYDNDILYVDVEEINKGEETALRALLQGYIQSEYKAKTSNTDAEKAYLSVLCSLIYYPRV
jgi:hypothetical protein